MTRPTKKPGEVQKAKGENWIKIKTKKSEHQQSLEVLEKVKKQREQFKEVIIKDETRLRCWICKLIKK